MNSILNKKFDLSWGNATCVRQAFLKGLSSKSVLVPLNETNLAYTPHEGDPKLIEITRRVIERQVGPTYNYILLTNGATGGVTIALRAFAQKGCKDAVTRNPPYFPLYPGMINAAGLKHVIESQTKDWDNPVILWDSPSNPQGFIEDTFHTGCYPMIHDAVYHNRVYTYGNYKALPCDVLVGSYSKLLGLNGLRTGWIATNDPLLYERMKYLVTSEYCGLSSASNAVLNSVLADYPTNKEWDDFETDARANLDDNRTQFSRLEKYFGDQRVYRNGMFYYGPVDSACARLLERSGIIWTKGWSLGTNDDFGRFNLAQDCKLVRDAVKTVLKNDKS